MMFRHEKKNISIVCFGRLENFVDYFWLANSALNKGINIKCYSLDEKTPFGLGEEVVAGPDAFRKLPASNRLEMVVIHGNGKGAILFLRNIFVRYLYIDIRTRPINKGIKPSLVLILLRLILISVPRKVIVQDRFVLQSIVGKAIANLLENRIIFAQMGYERVSKRRVYKRSRSIIKLVYAGSLHNRELETYLCKIPPHLGGAIEINFYSSMCGEIDVISKILDRHNIAYKFHGIIGRSELLEKLKEYDIGFSFINPASNYSNQVPTKIFDYLSAGLPVVTNCTEVIKHYFGDRYEVFFLDDLSVLTLDVLGNIKNSPVDYSKNEPTFETIWGHVVSEISES